MSQKNIQLSFFAALTLGLFVLLYFVFKPYLGIIFISAVLAIAFNPLYKKFLNQFGNRKSFSSMLTVLVIIFVIVIPSVYIIVNVFSEAVDLYNSLIFGGGAQHTVSYIDSVLSKFGYTDSYGTYVTIKIGDYFKDILGWIISHFDSVFSAIFTSALGFVLTLISIYYFLYNGDYIKKSVIEWSPLPDVYDEEVLETLRASVDAVLRGRFLIAVAQGVFLSLGFVIFGVGSPILWGFVGCIASLIPALGTSIITVPASIYLFINGNIGAGIGVLVWGALAVGFIDDTLSFFILKRKIKIHPLIILFSILGGVQFFGPIGFIAGPVLASAFFSILKIYPFIISYRSRQT